MENKKKPALWDNPQFIGFVSLVLAVLVWLVVTMVIDQDTSHIIRGVPVNFNYESRQYTSLGLDIVNEPEASVEVRLEGSGSIIGNIEADDLVVYPDYSVVKNAGEQVLNLNVRIANSPQTNGVTATIVSSNRTVEVVFDKIVTKTFPVTVEADDLKLAEGYVLNKTSCTPAEIVLEGPEREISKISSAVAHVTVDDVLADSVVIPAEVLLVDENGNRLDLPYTKMDNETVDIVITVYLQRELPLAINFINAPSGFDVNTLNYTLSCEKLKVAGTAHHVAALEEISVASFDLSSYRPNRSYQLPVELPNGFVIQEGISTVTLQIDSSNLTSTTMNVSNIRTINIPAGMEVTVNSTKINNVTLVGPTEVMENLVPGNVEAQIDGDDITVTDGMQNVPVHIVIPSRNDVFVAGTYQVQCTVSSAGG